jgi:hypothetical protein
MLRTSSRLTAVALAVTALVPAAAVAAGVHSHPVLKSSPQMRIVDTHHATLNFASDRLPRTAAGKVDAEITFVNGARVSGLKPNGTHGTDIRYVATVSSQRPLRHLAKYTVKFRLGDSSTVTRLVKLYQPGEHG